MTNLKLRDERTGSIKTSNKRMTKLEQFAKRHGLKVETETDLDSETLAYYESKAIFFKSEGESWSAIYDPLADHLMELMFGSQTAVAEIIRKFEIKSPLALTLSRDQKEILYEQIGFELVISPWEPEILLRSVKRIQSPCRHLRTYPTSMSALAILAPPDKCESRAHPLPQRSLS